MPCRAWLNLYTNGKSAARVAAPGVRHLGPHLFTGDPSPRYVTAANPLGAFVSVIAPTSHVLHYAFRCWGRCMVAGGGGVRDCAAQPVAAVRHSHQGPIFPLPSMAPCHLCHAAPFKPWILPPPPHTHTPFL